MACETVLQVSPAHKDMAFAGTMHQLGLMGSKLHIEVLVSPVRAGTWREETIHEQPESRFPRAQGHGPGHRTSAGRCREHKKLGVRRSTVKV